MMTPVDGASEIDNPTGHRTDGSDQKLRAVLLEQEIIALQETRNLKQLLVDLLKKFPEPDQLKHTDQSALSTKHLRTDAPYALIPLRHGDRSLPVIVEIVSRDGLPAAGVPIQD